MYQYIQLYILLLLPILLQSRQWSLLFGNWTDPGNLDGPNPYPGNVEDPTIDFGPDGALYFYGGYGSVSPSTAAKGNVGNLWKYNVSANVWTFLYGTNSINRAPNYANVMPGSLHEHSAVFDGNLFYVFGGSGMDGICWYIYVDV